MTYFLSHCMMHHGSIFLTDAKFIYVFLLYLGHNSS